MLLIRTAIYIKWIRWALLIFLPLAFLLACTACQFGYLLSQGIHQIRLLSERKPVNEVLEDPAVPHHIKTKIIAVQQVRAFGESRLGLRPTRSYQSYIEIDGDAVAYVVSAASKDDLLPYLWRFPIVGSFPYKGFFRIEDARRERNILESKGYDAFLSGAAAFSALGWFSDPLYSSMLEMDQVLLIYTILHEMVHGTVYFPSHADFNEQLATFVGWNGALAFLEFTYGRSSMQVRHAETVIRDEKTLAEFITWAHERLSLFYALPIPKEDKIFGRKRIFDEIHDAFEHCLAKFESERFSALKAMPWNNASILALWRYRYDTGHLEDLYSHVGRDTRALMALMKEWRKNRVDPQEALTEVLAGEDASDEFGSQKALAPI